MLRPLSLLASVAVLASCANDPAASSSERAQQPLTAGAPTLLGGPIELRPATFLFPNETRAASSGTTTLVVYANRLNAMSVSESRLRGVRLDANGAVLDPTGFDIGPLSEDEQFAPDVAFNGTDFAVVWRVPGRVLFTFVTPAGVVRLPAPTELATVAGTPEVACLATECLAVWSQASDIYGARVDASGARIGNAFAIATGAATQTDPQVTVSGSSFFVAWREGPVVGAFVTGTTVSPTVTLPPTAPTEHDLAGTSTVLAVWSEAGNIRGARITSAGVVLDGSGFNICTAAGTQSMPRVSWTGTQWVVTWSDDRNSATFGRDVYGARVSTTGMVLETNGTALATGLPDDEVPTTSWRSASSGTLVYQRRGTGAGEATLRGVSLSIGTTLGTTGTNRDLVRYANAQTQSSLAWNGSRYLAVWRDGRDGGAIVGARFFADAGLQDTAAVWFAAGSQFDPQVVSSGASFLVTWKEAGRVRSAVLGSTGAPVIASSSLSSTVSTYDIASNGGSVLMVWVDYGLPTPSGVGIRASYGVGGTPFELWSTGDLPTVTAGPGSQFTAVWRQLGGGLRLARISGSTSFDAGVLTSDPADLYPRVSVIGSSTLVTWGEYPARRLEGLLLSPTGTSALTISDDAGTYYVDDLASDGTQWVLLAGNPKTARRIDLQGVERDPSPLVLYPQTLNPWVAPYGKLVCPAPRQCQLVSSVFDPAPGAFAYRVSARPLLLTDPPVASAQNVSVVEDTPQTITLGGSDPDGDTLSFSVVTPPTRGTLSGTPPAVTYTPALNATGSDSFTFVASDGLLQSAPATVSITITPVNDPPVAGSQVLQVSGGMPVPFVLTANDVDGDPLTFTVLAGPDAGTLSGTPPNLTCQPAPTFGATDVVSFRASDGLLSSTGTVTFQRVGGGPGGGSAGGGSAGGGTAGGASAGGAAGGSTAGGSAGGSSAGGSAGGAAGGSSAGGSAGGASAGGAAGGASAGGAAGGASAGGAAGGEAGGAAGGSSAGGSAAGGDAAGGSAGGAPAGGGTGAAGGFATAGGTAGGSTTMEPPTGCGCTSGGQPAWLVVVALLGFVRRRSR